jgi:hypothetical protein
VRRVQDRTHAALTRFFADIFPNRLFLVARTWKRRSLLRQDGAFSDERGKGAVTLGRKRRVILKEEE